MGKYSNSPLVVYTKLSPNHSGQRTKEIDTIAIHCMAGNCTVETCGELFASKSRGASSQYGIGSDGRVAMYVEEKNRSWCTSSAAVDQRAITIEVANTSNKHPWPISDKAYDSLVKLCVDICKRNNIKKLLWEGNKALMGNVARQNLVVHRWTANKACPGDVIYNLHDKLVKDVNNKLGITSVTGTVITPTPKPTQATNVIQGTPEKIIWNFFRDKGLNDYAIAGLMGNLYAESGLASNNLQNSYEKSLKMDDEEYTAAVDNGKYKNFIKDKAGYGLAQWTYWSRKEALLNYANETKRSIGDLQMQCEFLWIELNSGVFKTKVLPVLKAATSVQQASDIVLMEFEKPANAASRKAKRLEYSESYYKKNAKGDKPNTLPYKVKVNDVTGLNIRKGAGTNFKIVGKITDNGVYTIVQEAVGQGAKKWGRLKSGAGWISLDYCIKLS